jgi:hypothetical protein
MQKHSDQFEIHSKLGVGTTIRCQIERKGDWAMKRREGI